MKNIKLLFAVTLSVLITSLVNITSFSEEFSEELKVYGEYSVGNLTFTSYSKSWKHNNLKDLYLELLNNFHGDEFLYLKEVHIYDSSPYGVNGLYKEDVRIKDGKYIFGTDSYIKIFNGSKYNTIEKIAPILSHEYGHHYTFYHLLNYENVYYNNFKDSEYYKIRELNKYPINLGNSSESGYIYHWDITEILADDYVQLLGSSKAKKSFKFKDLEELAKDKENLPKFYNNSFNLKPQHNPYLPLASQVKGLYSYFLKIAGFTSLEPNISKLPEVNKIIAKKSLDGKVSFHIEWTKAEGYGSLEYTVLMFPSGNPFSVIPIKTTNDNNNLNAVFGSFSIKDNKGEIFSISQDYPSEIEVKIHIKDERGFIYSSDSFYFDLSKIEASIKKEASYTTANNKNYNSKVNIKNQEVLKVENNTKKSNNKNFNFKISNNLKDSISSMIKHLKIKNL